MKIHISPKIAFISTASLIALAALTFVSASHAQIQRSPIAAPPSNNSINSDSSDALDSNYTLSVKGGVAENSIVDLVLVGAGPRFEASIGSPISSFEAIVTKNESQFMVSYVIRFQVGIPRETTVFHTEIPDSWGKYI